MTLAAPLSNCTEGLTVVGRCVPKQGAAGMTLAARLSGHALLPDMMFPAIHAFNPNNIRPPPTINGALPFLFGASPQALNNQSQARCWCSVRAPRSPTADSTPPAASPPLSISFIAMPLQQHSCSLENAKCRCVKL